MDTRTYGPVSRPQAEQFLVEAQQAGLAVTKQSDLSGEVTGMGAAVHYTYDERAQRITLNLVKHPPFFGGVVWSQIEQRLPGGATRL